MKKSGMDNVVKFNELKNKKIVHFENLLNQSTMLSIKVLLKDKENAIKFYEDQGYCMLDEDNDIDDELGEVAFITFQIDYENYE